MGHVIYSRTIRHHCAPRSTALLMFFFFWKMQPVSRPLVPAAQANVLSNASMQEVICSLCPPSGKFSFCHCVSQGQLEKTYSSADLHTSSCRTELETSDFFLDGYTS